MAQARITTHLCALAAALAAAGALWAGSPARAQTEAKAASLADPAPMAQTRDGPVQGVRRDALLSFFAIPYAAPPTGARRWRAPEPPEKWTQALTNTRPGAACIQTGAAFRSQVESEDCLTLDVHTPTGPGPFPVMVWIYGGAFTTGSTGFYADPTPLVSRGVVVVAMNYRLGALGFMAHPVLRDASGASGDYGIMDQQAALRWVQANISAFRGDPANVTIFGESAGGFSVLTHLAAPGSRGLFKKAIIESGAYGVSSQLEQADLERRSEGAVRSVLAAAGASAPPACIPDAPTAACLRALPEALVKTRLMAAFTAAVPNVMPSVDGATLPRSIKARFAAGDNAHVPVINGSNQDENLLFVALAELGARMKATPPNFDPTDRRFLLTRAGWETQAALLAEQAKIPAVRLTGEDYPLAAYGPDVRLQPSFAAGAAGTDATFSCNALHVSERIEGQGARVYMYEFRDQDPPPLVGAIGGRYVLSLPQKAAHASELPFLFNMADVGPPEQGALKAAMAAYWTNFAKSGDPNGEGLPKWSEFASGRLQALDVASRGGLAPLPAASFRTAHKCDGPWARLSF